MTADEVTDVDLGHWVSGARLFECSDGRWLIIDADIEEHPDAGSISFVRRDTSVFVCSEQATVTDMTADHTFPPGTTAEAALAELGYTTS